ncbi:MAG: outer membrane lipoprotein-sorting protein [bacterium]|nr:outer membrane lipoprotein-sorting protein [bacterium]
MQTQVERADRAMRRPDGLWIGRLSVAGGASGDRRAYRLRLLQKGEQRLLEFSSARRGLEARILYRDSGASIWFWDQPRRELARIRDGERLGPVLQSGFSFEDLSARPLEPIYRGDRRVERYRPSAPNANALSVSDASDASDRTFLRITLRPTGASIASAYGRVVLIVDPARGYRPLRRDLFNADRVLTRSLRYHYDSPVRVRSAGAGAGPAPLAAVPTRLEMLDLVSGDNSVIEYHEFDDVGELPDARFEPENLNR